MTNKRNVGLAILLSIVTCGIYMIYWYYSLISELYKLNDEPDRAVTDVILSIVTCGIYQIYMLYKMGIMSDNVRKKYGVQPKNQNILFLILPFFGLAIVVYAIVQSEINEELSMYGVSGNASQ